MGAVTSYARAKADGLGYDAKVGIAERPDRLVGILVPTFFADVLDLPDPARGHPVGAGRRGHGDRRSSASGSYAARRWPGRRRRPDPGVGSAAARP